MRGGDPAYIDLDPGDGKFELSNLGTLQPPLGDTGNGMYVVRLDANAGTFLSAHIIRPAAANYQDWAIPRIALDPASSDPSNPDILTVGYGSGITLDTGTADYKMPTVARADAFVLRTTQDRGAIAGRLFVDLNGNGVRDTGAWSKGEWDLTGFNDTSTNTNTDTRWTVTLLDASNNVVQTMPVGAAGEYLFNHLTAGTYTVLVNARPGWTSTNHPTGSFSITLGAGQYAGGMDFGMSPGPATGSQQADPRKGDWAPLDGGAKDLVTGLVWSAQNDLATWDYASKTAGSRTLNGFDDWRLPTQAEAIAAARSGVGVEATYTDAWTSNVSRSSAYAVNLGTGNTNLYQKSSAITWSIVRDSATRIDDGSTGYADTGWSKKSSSSAQDGDYRTAAKGTGSQTASWTFTGLQPGAAYRISASWLGASGNASNAPYQIYDGNTLLGTISANQTTSSNEYVIGNLGWQGLGTFRTTTGTLKIVLSNNANGTVVADSVRLFLVYPPAAGAPLLAAAGPASNPASATLTSGALQPLVQEAAARWQEAGLTPQQAALLSGVNVQIANLGGATLGLTSGNSIVIDDNAAGWGWFVDATPRNDSEFTTPGDQGEQGKIDLLTVLTHEMGHLLGLEHSAASGDVMNATLGSGVRLMPTAGDLPGSTLAGFAPSHADDAGKDQPHSRALAASSHALEATDALFAELAQRTQGA